MKHEINIKLWTHGEMDPRYRWRNMATSTTECLPHQCIWLFWL